MSIQVKILNKSFYANDFYADEDKGMSLPQYATQGSAGLDLMCTEMLTVGGGEIVTIHTGIAVWIASDNDIGCNSVGLIFPRSGLASKGLVLANTVGVIDEDYQGEIILKMWNRSESAISLIAGQKIAQLVFMPIIKAQWQVVTDFNIKTQRGVGGFGSTGE